MSSRYMVLYISSQRGLTVAPEIVWDSLLEFDIPKQSVTYTNLWLSGGQIVAVLRLSRTNVRPDEDSSTAQICSSYAA